MNIATLSTPALILDRARLENNAARMRQRASDLKVTLRPHMKTAKSHEVALVGQGGQHGPITVATLNEAEYFAAHGWTDITYAVCIAPQKLDRVAELTAKGIKLGILIDSLQAAQAVADHPGAHHVWIEIDCGEDRTGIAASDPALLQIAQCIETAARCTLLGVLTHGGQSYSALDLAEIVQVAEDERIAAVTAARTLRAAGIHCPGVSVGSTPTATHAKHLEGVTEMRPGVYLLGDLFQAGLGSCTEADIACSVLATVISHRRSSNRIIIDSGGLALSKDRSTQDTPFDAGYGRVVDAVTGTPMGDLYVASVHQEHGEVTSASELPWATLPLGTVVRVLPNHICMTAAMYERYHLVSTNGEITGHWGRTNGWSAPLGKRS